MRRYMFVAQVFALLIGFYVLCAALVAGLLALTVVAFRATGANRATVALLFVTLAAIFVVIRGVFVSTRLKARDIVGIEVHPAEQPALWAHIKQLASQVGTRAPRRLYLVPDVNAAVWENSGLLGLIPGRRQMMVGVPLLMALTPAQLDAVLAHELGHYGNRDTRLGGLVGRARQSVVSAVRAAATRKGGFHLPGAGLFIVLFRSYAKLVLRLTQEASRAQEYAADRVAAQIAGPANAIAALERMPGIDAAFDFYLARYVSPGIELGLLPPPPDLFGGFMGLLAEPSRQAQLEQIRENPASRSPDPYDSHPPMAERVAALAVLPHAGDPPQDSGLRAIGILANPGDALAAVALRALRKQVVGKQAITWDGLAQATGLRRADKRAEPLREVVARLTGRPADLMTFTELAGADRLGEVLDALPPGEAARRTHATGQAAREHAKTELTPMLTGWLVGHLVRTGQAAWAHSWADVGGDLRMASALKAELDQAVADIVAERPDATRLRALVAGTAASRQPSLAADTWPAGSVDAIAARPPLPSEIMPHAAVGQRSRPGRFPRAVLASVGLGILVLGAAVIVATNSSTSTKSSASRASTKSLKSPKSLKSSISPPPPPIALTSDYLQPGDCLQGSNMGLGTGSPWPELVTAVPCTQWHLAEVFFAGDAWPLSLTTYPGDNAVDNEADDRCKTAFAAYTGPKFLQYEPYFTFDYLAPDSATWPSGDRRLVCVAYEDPLWSVDYSIKG